MLKISHSLLHILGCLLPILAIFLLPLLGFSSGTAFTVFIVLMLACHLFMLKGHGHQHVPGPEATSPEAEERKRYE